MAGYGQIFRKQIGAIKTSKLSSLPKQLQLSYKKGCEQQGLPHFPAHKQSHGPTRPRSSSRHFGRTYILYQAVQSILGLLEGLVPSLFIAPASINTPFFSGRQHVCPSIGQKGLCCRPAIGLRHHQSLVAVVLWAS